MIWPNSRILTPSSGCDINCLSEKPSFGSKPQSARNNVALNFRIPPADNGQPRIPEKSLHWIFHAVAVAAENLQAEIGYRLVGFPAVELQHGGIAARCLALRQQPCEPVDQRTRHVEHDLHIRKLVRDRLELADRPPELLAVLGIGKRVFKRRRGRSRSRGGK